jgi:hypothetical protein
MLSCGPNGHRSKQKQKAAAAELGCQSQTRLATAGYVYTHTDGPAALLQLNQE